ncbi:A/G-specific adenine glycosylase [Deinococcus aquiradiocola]|uniref:Adenine DNA glycosylase n=1 Tax=Deinococcus aquiradiocola TaxID=393059 RepID=A0A917URS5_9DEIO|nr:A/G-specific adenine glycosylase [Deinococcus aquiradiocola]GGJ79989.1 A/G-specific adenine glycosylase [Deinococcus aquiradiocola]
MDVAALRASLLGWFAAQGRADLPWRVTREDGQRDPYRVWVAEVLLQQTQVVRGRVYFERFLTAFPTVQALALAPQEAVLKAWEGCGYYARARNLHRAAQVMAREGVPVTYDGWLALPGVGPYTAAAVSSLAFGEGRAVMDGNVRRVLSRLYAVEVPTDAWVQGTADALLDPARPGEWNEAVMDLGATVCVPKRPLCGACPLRAQCAALASGEPARYPAPKVRAAAREVRAVAVLAGTPGTPYLEERHGTLLGGLWGLPLEDCGDGTEGDALARLAGRLQVRPAERLGVVTHTMTHRHLTVTLYRADGALPGTPADARPLSRLDRKLLALAADLGVQRPLF